jgi:PilZ domain
LRCEVTLTWCDEHGVRNTIVGVVRDISAGGLFASSQHWPWAGTLAQVDIQLPSHGSFGQAMQLHGTGRVVRVVRDGERSGFALAGTAGWAMAQSRKQAAAKVS